MTAAAIDLSPGELSAEELECCKEFLVESWSPWRSSAEQQHLTSLLRYVLWLEQRLDWATRARLGVRCQSKGEVVGRSGMLGVVNRWLLGSWRWLMS